MEVEIKQYIGQEIYKVRIIQVEIIDAAYEENRVTKLCCPEYSDEVIVLYNATDLQIKYQMDNLFAIAKEKIDENSIINKVKKLFR